MDASHANAVQAEICAVIAGTPRPAPPIAFPDNRVAELRKLLVASDQAKAAIAPIGDRINRTERAKDRLSKQLTEVDRSFAALHFAPDKERVERLLAAEDVALPSSKEAAARAAAHRDLTATKAQLDADMEAVADVLKAEHHRLAGAIQAEKQAHDRWLAALADAGVETLHRAITALTREVFRPLSALSMAIAHVRGEALPSLGMAMGSLVLHYGNPDGQGVRAWPRWHEGVLLDGEPIALEGIFDAIISHLRQSAIQPPART